MKTLYVSDLDGTLLTSEKKLTKATIELLNKSIAEGAQFAIATARMPYACDYRMKEINLNIPSILTNGVFLYDFSKGKYVSVETMTKSEAINVIDAFEKSQLGIFLYSFENGEISIFYNDKSILKQTQYYSDKAIEKCKKIEFVADIRDCVNENNVFYIACTGQESSLINAKRRIENVPGVEIAFYLNIYNGDYCIEIFTDKASKKNAIIKLKEILACDEVVVFGDNLNDLSMFEIAQRKYAVSNALEAVKSEATEVIASCDEDGVARFIANELQKQMEDR